MRFETGAERSAHLLALASIFFAALAVNWTGLTLHTGAFFPQSNWPYFIYYARALLDGQLSFSVIPPNTHDLSPFEGEIYMHFPPFPAVLLMPFVKLFGLGVSDRFFSVFLGALNGVLFRQLLLALARSGLMAIPQKLQRWLTLFFLFGTVHFYLAITGNPWTIAHVVCNTLVISAFWLCLERKYWAACFVWVAVLFTRTHVFMMFPILVATYWCREGQLGRQARERLTGLLPMVGGGLLGVFLLLAFNYARFGDPFENGVSYHLMHPIFRQSFERFGYLHWIYIPRNLNALLLLTPVSSTNFPYFTFTPEGLSIFLTSPLYIYLFRSLGRETRTAATVLWIGIALAALPILMLMGTGEYQFGHRYSSDLQVPLILLTAMGMRARVSKAAIACIVMSILMNGYGAYWFVSHFAN